MACCGLLPPSSHLSCASVVLQVKPTAWAGQSTAGWASGQGRRRRARPRSSRSSPASLLSHAAHRSATPSAVTVSAGAVGLGTPSCISSPPLICPSWCSAQPGPAQLHRTLLAGSGLEPGPGADRPPSLGAAGQQLLKYFCGPLAAKFMTRVLTRRGSLACRSLPRTLNSAAARPPCSGAARACTPHLQPTAVGRRVRSGLRDLVFSPGAKHCLGCVMKRLFGLPSTAPLPPACVSAARRSSPCLAVKVPLGLGAGSPSHPIVQPL